LIDNGKLCAFKDTLFRLRESVVFRFV